MDKINFKSAIDSLKNTDCSAKEKIQKFDQIESSLSSLNSHSNYKNFLQNAVQVLLLFCEDNDSNVKIAAEENLNRIIHRCEKQNEIVLIQIELYHLIKKNGNERSLRICLNLFSHYCRLIKHRRRKVYAQNLVTCLLAIAKRREPLVIETSMEFMKSFSKYLLNCLSDFETMKLIEVFMDNLLVECPIKRRCSAQNIITVLEYSAKQNFLMKSIVTSIQENLTKNQDVNSTSGSLGLLRILIPMLVTSSKDYQKVVELLETCLNYLKTEQNHTIINASLEVISSLLIASNSNNEMKELLCDGERMIHKEMLLSRHSALLSSSRKSSIDTIKNQDNFLQIPTSTSLLSTPNKSLGDFSDVEGDSFKSSDFDSNMPASSSSPGTLRNVIGAAETMSIKSTDSINSFFSSILSSSNTDTVTKFFRKSSSSESPAHQPKLSESVDDKSLDISLSQFKDENVMNYRDSQQLPDAAEIATESLLDETLEIVDDDTTTTTTEAAVKELYIGSIYDQSIIEYVVRLISSKYLLEGTPKILISDQVIRVSIKNLALSVIAACVELKSEVLLMKLSKDYTDESMMVESLLSFLVDEDIRLEEEEKKKKNDGEKCDSTASSSTTTAMADQPQNFLEIKDDHFGECSTATFLDYFSPLSKTIDDQGLISLKNRIYEEKTKDREECAKKINRDLCQLLSRSEIMETKKLALPLMETTLKMPDDKDCQFIADVLMYVSHGDPVLRGNIYLIIGNFVKNILERNLDYDKFIENYEFVKDSLNFNKMIDLLLTGIRDEVHSVVKQTLAVWENCVNIIIAVMSMKCDVENIINQILMVFYNKYWLVQCKYCDVITNINFEILNNSIGHDRTSIYEKQIRQHLFSLIKDNDFRVRNYASEGLLKWIIKIAQVSEVNIENTNSLMNFVEKNFFKFESFSCEMKINYNYDTNVEHHLSKVLYELSNFMMDIKDKNQQFGVIYALKILIKRFNPISYPTVWKEFNFLNILLSFMNKNSAIALDVSCQCDMLQIISALIEADVMKNGMVKDNNEYLMHLLKILNIYAHLVNNTKLLIVPKGKSDLFTSARELALINSLGFFSNDHFYLKFYLVLKSSYESYRMTINQDAELKLKHLLHLTLKSIQILLEFRMMSMEKNDSKLIEEIVSYLNQLIGFQPGDCITTTKILLKFLFKRNYCNRRDELDHVRDAVLGSNSKFVFEKFETFSSFDATGIAQNFDNLIKLFDALVIQGLRLFSKSSSEIQTKVLDMLCQLLELNINYMQLDSKKVFVDFVLRQLEYIENGLVMEGECLAPKIIEFLIYLTKLKDKKILTMPKIINIIDNLLASTNNSARMSGIQALLTLTLELFFRSNKTSSNEAEIIEAHQKDVNAQREVALSMMIKFVDNADIQECIEWILLKSKVFDERLAIEIDDNEIYQNLLQSLNEKSSNQCMLVRSIGKNIVLESKNFKSIVGLYWKLIDNENVSSLNTIVFLQENILNIAEEIYLVNHIKLYHQKQSMEGDAVKVFLKSHLKYLEMLILNQIHGDTLDNFLHFLQLEKFPSIYLDLKETLDAKRIIEISHDPTLDSIMKFLISLDYKLNEIESFINLTDSSIDHVKMNKIFYKNVFLKRSDIKAWNGNEIMSFFKDTKKIEILLKYCANSLLSNLLEDEEISKVIIRKLSHTKASTSRIKFIMENIHESCLNDTLIFLLSQRDDSKILQMVMVKKLHLIKNQSAINISANNLESLKMKIIDLKMERKFIALLRIINELIETDENNEIDFSEMNKIINEEWLLDQAKMFLSSANGNFVQLSQMLYEIKSDSKLMHLLSADDFNIQLFASIINVSFDNMLTNFRVDCIQINPHLNYMKIPPLLKASVACISNCLENINSDNVIEMAKVIMIYMKRIDELNDIALIYVEAKFIEKFISDHLLKPSMHELLLKFLNVMINQLDNNEFTETLLEAIQSIFINESINVSDVDDKIISWIFNLLHKSFEKTNFVVRYQHPPLFDELHDDTMKDRVEIIKRVIFIAHIQETYDDGEFESIPVSSHLKHLIDISFNLSRYILRIDKFYQFTITPYQVILNYRSGDDLLDKTKLKLKQIPIEYLSDSDLLECYVKRINQYGFTHRQEFEEIFMTLLVLLNQFNEMQDAEEQFCIRQLCLQTNVDLILSCFRHKLIDNQNGCNYVHLSRYEKCQEMNKIGVKKLHHLQELVSSKFNVFYQPNLERISIDYGDNIIKCKSFGMNQFSLNFTWQMTNESGSSKINHCIRNMTYTHVEKLGIDYKSALQLIYDLMTQMIDEHPFLVLPQLAKLIEILDNNEQFKWINKKMLALYETVCGEDTISHQYIIYLLCRSSAVLVPTLSEIQLLIPIINKYLMCNHMYVRIATLHGLLCLFESLHKMNTTIGVISDEMKLLRTTIVNYTNKNGIVYECSSTSTSPQHDKLVWSLNFYVIENTLKFGDCSELLIDTIISANNILKRTNDIDLYFLIINGLERIIIADTENKLYREKVEKLSLDLLKMENKNFSIGGLKLLVTCMYIGSLQQLENTELSNGIVQDELEIVMQSTEKIEILFNRIRNATADEAEIFGRVLERILKDLLSPNEILTKIIKELLILNQSNTIIISKIIHQVFRTAIDSSFLVLLQEWLICSLSNFLSYPNHKKSILFLSLIFMSSTLNLHLLKLFPITLDEDISESDLHRMFIVSAKDFYGRLSDKQKAAFRDAFNIRTMTSSTSNSPMHNLNLFQQLMKHL